MAITSAAVWECRATATAANANGGFYKTGATGVDYSQQDAAQYSLTGGTTAAANAIILHASASADMVGNGLHLISGTNVTAGWYEITAVSVGVSITVDRTCTTAAGALMVFNIGGALSLADSTDGTALNAPTPGNTIWIKSGTYAIGSAISGTQAGTQLLPVKFTGYNSARGDNPSFANCPLINMGANAAQLGNGFTKISYLSFTGTAATMYSVGGNQGQDAKYCKFVNTSTTAGRIALSGGGTASYVYGCEFISYRGIAYASSATGTVAINCYMHDSDIGMSISNTAAGSVIACIIADCVTAAWKNTVFPATNSSMLILGCTLYGAENKLGIGIQNGTSGGSIFAFNNIIYGFATGISFSNAITGNQFDFNDFFNNTTARTNISAGANDQAVNPTFTNVTQIALTSCTISGSTLTKASADFSSVVDNQDFCYIVSGTGATAGKYLITAHTTTTLTLSSAPGGSGTNIVAQITLGHNFQIGTNLKALGAPGLFPAGLTQSYLDIGAVQRQEAGGASGMLYTPGMEGLG